MNPKLIDHPIPLVMPFSNPDYADDNSFSLAANKLCGKNHMASK
jgi:hypothetical protein